jgi:hypothetical protein
VDSLLPRRRQFWGCGFSHDFGTIFCAKGKLLPIESKLSCFPIFASDFSCGRRKEVSDRGLLRKIRGHTRSQLDEAGGQLHPLHL